MAAMSTKQADPNSPQTYKQSKAPLESSISKEHEDDAGVYMFPGLVHSVVTFSCRGGRALDLGRSNAPGTVSVAWQ